MAKKDDKDAAASMAAELPPAAEAEPVPTLQEIAERDPIMAALLKQLEDMKAEIAALKNPPETKAAGAPVRDFAPEAAFKAPKTFSVSLPHAPTATVTIETDGVREIDWKDRAVEEYKRRMSILRTEHQFTALEV